MEILQYFFDILGPVGLCVGICIWVLHDQKKQTEILLNFMLDQIKKQTEVLEVIKEDLIMIKDELNNLKGDS